MKQTIIGVVGGNNQSNISIQSKNGYQRSVSSGSGSTVIQCGGSINIDIDDDDD